MKKPLPKPSNWQDFEDLNYLLWKFYWNDRHTRKNGRQGQAQHGVDVYGRPFEKGIYEGVQCKGKSDWADTTLTIEEIKKELIKAKSFSPSIKTLTFATTAPSDAKLLKEVRALDSSLFSNIHAEVQSWDELEVKIKAYPEVLRAFYSDADIRVHWKRDGQSSTFHAEISIVRPDLSMRDLMKSEMSRIHIAPSLRHDLMNVTSEIAFNAAKFSDAKSCLVLLTGDTYAILCDGTYFDLKAYLDNPNSVRHGGMTEVASFLKTYEQYISLSSFKDKMGSRYEFRFSMELADAYPPSKPYVLDVGDFISRDAAEKVAIPKGARLLVINLGREVGSLSNFAGLVSSVASRIDEHTTLQIKVEDYPEDNLKYLKSLVIDKVQSGNVVFI